MVGAWNPVRRTDRRYCATSVLARRTLALGLVALGWISSEVAAQEPMGVEPGTVIRVSSSYLGEGWLRGRVDTAMANRLVLGLDGRRNAPTHVMLSWSTGDSLFAAQTDSAAIPFIDPALRLEISTAQRRAVGRGALIGGAVGAALGLTTAAVLAGIQESGPPTGEELCTFSECASVFVPVGGLSGLALGALVGSMILRHDWREIGPATVQIGGADPKGSLRLGLRVEF